MIPDLGHLRKDASNLDSNAFDAINYTWAVTKDIPSGSLSAWSHKDGSPWFDAFKPDVNSIPIKNESISQYFTNLLAAS